jgi:hypothetical protein
MYIFYDFETSSIEQIGQILTYSFILTDFKFDIRMELNDKIKLNRTQLPDIGAILTNRINITEHQKTSDPEYIAADKICKFLGEIVDKYGRLKLVGYNANSFDLNFLRNLLIRYGYNPYFEGRLENVDILHYVKHLALENPEKYPWQTNLNKENKPYYSFKLENTSKAFNILETEQTHSAREDVILTIELVKILEKTFSLPLSKFNPIQIPANFEHQDHFEFAKQKVVPWEIQNGNKYSYKYWLKLFGGKKDKIVLDLEKYENLVNSENSENKFSDNKDPELSCVRFINHNKHFFVLEEFGQEDYKNWQATAEKINHVQFFKNLTRNKYFELIKKDWDIEYQIYDMGFERIVKLRKLVKKLLDNPDTYSQTLQELLKTRNDKKDNYLIQLFNRVYLNFHPNPKPEYLLKYLEPRYITGKMLRSADNFTSLNDYEIELNKVIQSETSSEQDKALISSLNQYFVSWKNLFN